MLATMGGLHPSLDDMMVLFLFLLLWMGAGDTATTSASTTSRPYIMNHPQNMTVVEGQRVLFNCVAEAFPDNITYYWYKDGTDVRLLPVYNKRLSLQADGKLLITGVVKEDMGWYACRPSNGIGQDEANAYLNVIYLPRVLINLMPSQVTWAKGFREKLDCPVDSNPPLVNTMWSKGQTVVDSRGRFDVLLNGTLLVSDVMESDAGFYACTPSNAMGSGVASPNVQVLVKDPPYFTVRPQSQYQRLLREGVVMNCAAAGTPEPSVTWRKVGSSTELVSDGRVVLQGGNLTITSTVKDDHGQYECVASNVIATIISPTELRILNTTPHAPYNVTVTPGLFEATVSWSPAYDGGKPQFYMVWFRQYGAEWNGLQVPSQGQATSYTVYQLQPDTVYEFMVLARNEYGNGSFSEPVRAQTLGYQSGLATALPVDANGFPYYPNVTKSIGPPPTPARNLTAKLMTNGSVQLTWQPSLHPPVPVFWYTVDYRERDSKTQVWRTYGERVLPQEQGTRMNMNLAPGTYEVRVIAFGVLAFSVPSNIVTVIVPAEGNALPDALIGGIVGGVLFLLVAVLLTTMAIIHSRRKDSKARNADVSYGKPGDMNSLQQTASKRDRWQQDGGGDLVTSLGNNDSIFFVPRAGAGDPSLTHDPAVNPQRGRPHADLYRDPLYRDDLGYLVARAQPQHVQGGWGGDGGGNPPYRPAAAAAAPPQPPPYYSPRAGRPSSPPPLTYQGSHPLSAWPDEDEDVTDSVPYRPQLLPRSRSQPPLGSSSSSRRFPSDPHDPRSPKPWGNPPPYPQHHQPRSPRGRGASAPREGPLLAPATGPGPPYAMMQVPPPPYKKSPGGSSSTLPPKLSRTSDGPGPDPDPDPGPGPEAFDGRGVSGSPPWREEPARRSFGAPGRHGEDHPPPPPKGHDGPFQSFRSEEEEDDDVFPSPLQPGLAPHHHLYQQHGQTPSFPRHSSMKPSALRTYLTGEGEGPPGLTLSDISSVLDPPAEQPSSSFLPTGSLPPPRRSWQPSQESSRSFPLPSSPYSADVTRDGAEPSWMDGGGGGGGSQRGRGPALASKPPADDSSDSSGRPLGYTRDHLHDVVGRVRQAPARSRHGPDSHPGDRYLDVSSQGAAPRGDAEKAYPGYPPYSQDVSSSGLGSRSNASHSAGGSLRGLRLASSTLPGEDPTFSSSSQPFSSSIGSSSNLNNNNNNHRRDTSADENYEFDHLPALESDILDDLQRYSRLAGSGPGVGKGMEGRGGGGGARSREDSSPEAVLRELYPKPSKQSQYADAAQRFQRLREEFQQYRQQRHGSVSPLPYYSLAPSDGLYPHRQQQQPQPLYPMDSEML